MPKPVMLKLLMHFWQLNSFARVLRGGFKQRSAACVSNTVFERKATPIIKPSR
ncbi:hypothetical protein MARI_11690 [Marinobacter sp. JH2]|nr:hypothetical protein MARI_11690 [Marinobacter sp. JH2]